MTLVTAYFYSQTDYIWEGVLEQKMRKGALARKGAIYVKGPISIRRTAKKSSVNAMRQLHVFNVALKWSKSRAKKKWERI